MEYMAVHTVAILLIRGMAIEDETVRVNVLDVNLNDNFNAKVLERLREQYPDYTWLDWRIVQIDTKLVDKPNRFEAIGLDTWKMTG